MTATIPSACVQQPERIECQHDEHSHHHVHPKENREPEEKPASHHQKRHGYPVLIFIQGRPLVHHGNGHKSRDKGEQRQQEHRMLPKKDLAEHDYPQIERRFVSVCLPVKGESEDIPVLDGLVSDQQVTRLIVRREIPHDHHRQ